MANPQEVCTFYHVNCPIDVGTIEEMAANHEAALKLFKKLCPPGVHVLSIEAIRRKRKKKCAWAVKYVRDIAPQYENIDPAEDLVLKICRRHPNNTQIIKQRRIPYPPAVELVYSIYCSCEVSPNAGILIKNSPSVETINADLITLKFDVNTVNLHRYERKMYIFFVLDEVWL